MTCDSQDLISLIRSILKNRGAYAVNEEATKQGVVLPLVARLGWDRDNILEVAPEYAVGRGRVDYCLKRGDDPAVFLEVKRLDQPLDGHEEQLLRYAFERGITLAALTDGVRWWLYLPTQPNSSWAQRRFFTINLEEQEPEDVAAHFRKYLGKQEVLSGSALRTAQEVHASHAKKRAIQEAIPTAWRELCEQPDPQLVELLSEKVEGRCGYKPDPEGIEEYIVGRQKLQVPLAGPTRGRSQGETVSPGKVADNRHDRVVWTHRKAVSFTFLGAQHQVSRFKDILLGLATLFYEKNPDLFFARVGPLKSNRGKSYYTRNRDSLQDPWEIGRSGIWAETCLSAEGIRERCHELLETFGHGADDLHVELRPKST